MMTIFEQLELWLGKNRTKLETNGFSIKFVQGAKTDNTGAYLDIDSNKFIARATLWESMEFQVEAMRILSGEQFFWDAYKVENMDHVFQILEDFFTRLE
jgi:DNA-dependent RNA polymerase auxiliary subunit epsilon